MIQGTRLPKESRTRVVLPTIPLQVRQIRERQHVHSQGLCGPEGSGWVTSGCSVTCASVSLLCPQCLLYATPALVS